MCAHLAADVRLLVSAAAHDCAWRSQVPAGAFLQNTGGTAQDPQRGSRWQDRELADRFHPEAPKFDSLASADAIKVLDRLWRQELLRFRWRHVLDAAPPRAG
ncbi:hypothetical protein J2Z21_001290 [Streptomyces griseochromogenes]|uniref:Uncharacterized protein n=1 Tax=Streptomyces griseochromogenes TaxID=68214 RepID=A0A1B1ATX1_9ACTN|nr:hypothetical protein [Streptomyces griseochromogenes]ANP50028.1 hypothetical protein AVL59_10755 [Streptomyces griseochromogenes]MBP2048366.1 hypothetical protein [Streptomyces griseochromogenes]